MKKKKRIKIIIIAVLVVAVAAGSITGVVYYRNSKGLASVMSVSMISTTNDYTSMTSGVSISSPITTSPFSSRPNSNLVSAIIIPLLKAYSAHFL